tara:strand:- start:10229 stop:10687 length:459 start_codon:yes stop_codon:yes gene_type:complete
MELAIIHNWNERFGYYDVEVNDDFQSNDYNIQKCVNYMKRKKFIIYSWGWAPLCVENELINFIDLYKDLVNIELRVPVRRVNRNSRKKYRLCVVKKYVFASRTFCTVNLSFIQFIQKCKKYYSQKLAYYKQPKSLIYRQTYGKYNFKFNNAL